MKTKPTPKNPPALPKAHVRPGWQLNVQFDGHLAVIPCRTAKEARARVAFERLKWEQKATKIAQAFLQAEHGGFINWVPNGRGIAAGKAVLLAQGHTEGGA